MDQLRRFGKHGTLTGIILLTIFSSDPETLPDPSHITDKIDECDGAMVGFFKVPKNNMDDYMNRICDLIEDSARFGYI